MSDCNDLSSIPTPRTDAEEANQRERYERFRDCGDGPFQCDFDFARLLERELAKSNEERWRWLDRWMGMVAQRDQWREVAGLMAQWIEWVSEGAPPAPDILAVYLKLKEASK